MTCHDTFQFRCISNSPTIQFIFNAGTFTVYTSFISALVAIMPPVHSKGSRPDFSGTPRGYRTEKGSTPRHQAKGGKSDYPETPRGKGKGKESEKERRDSVIESAFQQRYEGAGGVQETAKDFQEALCLVLRRQTAINSEETYEELINHEAFIRGSKHFSYVFRHSLLPHEDGSLSLNELLSHRGTQIKLKNMRTNGPATINKVEKAILRTPSRHAAVEFLLPLAHAICNSNKERVQIGLMEVENFRPGTTPPNEAYFSPAAFTATTERETQADEIEEKSVASVFIRFESGHSNETVATHPLFNSAEFPYNYLLHGTSERNLSSIRQNGLMPGGTRRSRKDVHFTIDFTLTTMMDSLRPESDCILVYKIDALDDLDPRITKNNYVLTKSTVPANRLLGVWSLQDSQWIQKPKETGFSVMNNIESNVELLLHIAHHQRFWRKLHENEESCIVWSRQKYRDHVLQYLKNTRNVQDFLTCWRAEPVTFATPKTRKQMSNPNERELHEKDVQDKEREQNMREIKQRFLANVKKEQGRKSKADIRQESSDSDASSVQIQSARLGVGPAMSFMKEKGEQLAAKAKAKTSKVWKVKSDNRSQPKTYAEAASSSASARSSKSFNKQPEARRQTNPDAKRMLEDADIARQVYDRIQKNLTQDFTNIEWWQRPEGELDCANKPTCGKINAIFWCHVCGKAFCIQCRHNGRACEIFLPDSIGAKKSPVDIEQLRRSNGQKCIFW